MKVSGDWPDLIGIMAHLRSPKGCAWDRKQTLESLRPYLVEECYEALDALDRGDPQAICEELGDLLLQIVFWSQLAAEQNWFTAEDVVRAIQAKLIRRHPHVFGDGRADTPEEVERNWEAIKEREKGAAPRSRLDSVSTGLPPLVQAGRLGEAAARVGFDWDDLPPVLEQVRSELRELEEAIEREDSSACRAELGDVLFSLVMVARHLSLDPEQALSQTNRKFRSRFAWMERQLEERGLEPDGVDTELLEELWNRAKVETD